MAVNLRENSADEMELNHEINVTPFIDVILVLLIIFMVAAPLSTSDVAINLPASTNAPQPRAQESIFVSLKTDGSLFVGNDQINAGELIARLEQLTENDHERQIFIRADKDVAYGEIMGLLNSLQRGHYLKVGLVGEDRSSGGSDS